VITTIRVVRGTNMFKAKGMVLEGISMSKMGMWWKLELGIIVVNTEGSELGKTMGGIRVGA
jgi:hypothetical protein